MRDQIYQSDNRYISGGFHHRTTPTAHQTGTRLVDTMHIASCPTGFGAGGLGQHLEKVHRDTLDEGARSVVYCHGGLREAVTISGDWERRLFRWPPFRWRPDLRVWWRHERFDREVARRLVPCGTFLAFMGCGLHSFRRARALGAKRLIVEMPNSHPENVIALHALAAREHGFERSWMGGMFSAKAAREFAMADEIRANSDYTARTVVSRGTSASKVVRRHLGCAERFSRVVRSRHPDGLRVAVCVGSMTVAKGIPFIVETFREIPGDDLRLVLVGGWTSRGMRLWIEAARRRDPRVSWTSGDPAPHLASATVAVHPSFEDGWGYAPAEALAVGVPLAVSDQTGAMELLDGSPARKILPVGDHEAWRRWMADMLGGAAP